MAIVKICQGQPELAVRLVTPGCNGAQLVDWAQIRMVIMPPARTTCQLPLSPMTFKGCWPTHDIEKYNNSFCRPEQLPLLIYPAFGMNDDGEIVFILDSQLWSRKGRYIGRIEFLDGGFITDLDLDICSQQFVADKISLNSVKCEG